MYILGLATLLEGAGCFFTCWKWKKILYFNYGGKKAVKLENIVLKVRVNVSSSVLSETRQDIYLLFFLGYVPWSYLHGGIIGWQGGGGVR